MEALNEAVDNLEQSRSHSDRVLAIGQTQGVDRLRGYALGVVGSFPVIGDVLQAAIDVHIPAARERRLDDFLSRLAIAVDELEATRQEVQQVPQDYADIVEIVLEDVIRTSEEEKRQAYAYVLVNALEPANDEEKRLMFLDLLRRSRTVHIRILAVLMDPATERRSHLLQTVMERLPGYETETVRVAWADLLSWGLIAVRVELLQDSSVFRQMEQVSRALSVAGWEFLQFIAAPRSTHSK